MMASFKPIETYEVLRSQKCSISTIIEWHFEEVLKSINRKISLKWKYKDPFTCTVFRELHRDTFHQAFRAVRDYKITLGVKASITKNKKKSFINELFSKTFACGSVGKIVITEKKPLEITYKCSTSTMQLKCHY